MCKEYLVMYKDHLGNEFKTIVEMCKYWGVSYYAYINRELLGWTLEDALTRPHRNTETYDHLGNKFRSVDEMCKYYDISRGCYEGRKRKGWSLEQILTTKKHKKYCITHSMGI